MNENATPVDVMSLDNNSEIAARLHANPVIPVAKAGFRTKSNSPKRRAGRRVTPVRRIAHLLDFEHMLPFEINFNQLDNLKNSEVLGTLYDYGCKTYAILHRLAYGETAIMGKNDASQSSLSTIARIAKSLIFSSSDSPAIPDFPSVDDLFYEIEKKGLHDYLLLDAVRVAIQKGGLNGSYVYDPKNADPTKLCTELAAATLIALADTVIRCRASQNLEKLMGTPDGEEGDGLDDEDEEHPNDDEIQADYDEMIATEQANTAQGKSNVPEGCVADEYEFRSTTIRLNNKNVETFVVQQNALLELSTNLGFTKLLDISKKIDKLEYELDPSETTPLIEAACVGNLEAVKKLVEWGCKVDAPSKLSQNTPLIYAAAAGHLEVVEYLLSTNKASPQALNCNGHDALMCAASMDRMEVVECLINAGVEARFINVSAEFKESALTLAAYKGFVDIAEFLLKHRKKIVKEDEELKLELEEEMHTALMESCMDGSWQVARMLLENGAQVNMTNESFESPLTLACCGGYNQLAKILIDAGANIEMKNDDNYTPLMETIREGKLDTVKLLLKFGANVNAVAGDVGDTPLTVAATNGYRNILEVLVEHGGDLTLGASPPIVEAAQEGFLDIVEYILEKCSNIPQEQLNRALSLASEFGYRSVVIALLNAGADANAYFESKTALIRATTNGHLATVYELVKNGAIVDLATEKNEGTALSVACSTGNNDIVKYLLKKGSNPFLEFKEGQNCFMEASRGGNLEVMNTLIEYKKNGGLPEGMKVPEVPEMIDDDSSKKPKVKAKRKSSGSHMSMNEMMMIPTAVGKKKSATKSSPSSPNDVPVSSREVDILQHLLRLQRQMVLYDNHPSCTDISEEKKKEVSQALKALTAVYGTNTEGKIRFPQPPSRTDLDKMYCGEMVPSIKQWAELVAYGWLEIERYCGHPIELGSFSQCNEGHSTNAAAAVSAAAAAAIGMDSQTYLATVFAKMNNGEEIPRVPATVGSLNAASAAMSGISFHSEEAMQIFNQQMQYFAKNPKHSTCSHHHYLNGVQSESAFRSALIKMGNAFRERKSNNQNLAGTSIADIKRHFPLPDEHQESIQARNKKNFYASLSAYKDDEWIRLALESEKKYQMHNTVENRNRAILTAYLAAVSEMNKKNEQTNLTDSDLDPGANILKRLLNGLSSSEMDETINRAREIVDPEGKRSEQNLAEFVDFGDGNWVDSFYEDCMLSKQENNRFVPDGKKKKKIPNTPVKNELKETVSLRRTHSEGDEATETSKSEPADALHKTNYVSLDTPLLIACADGYSEIAELLINEGANIEYRDKKGFTPLIVAATAGHASVCEVLLKYHAAIDAQSDRTKDTALSLACSGGRKEVVELLLKNNSNKEHRNVSDYTPLSLAASGGYIDIVNMLLNAGAEINSRTGSKLGISPLMLAAMNGHREATRVLLEKGSDINAQIETNRNTALTLACFQGRTEVVKLLLQYNANVEHRAKTGLTPLMEAANGGYAEIGSLLLTSGADPNAAPVPSSRDSALTIAADKGHESFVKMLLHSGAQVDVKNKKGCTALWLACNGGHQGTVEALVTFGADPDAFDNRKISPMMASFKKGHVGLIKFLVQYAKQFPSDQDLQRAITSAENDEIREKCSECMKVIRDAKNTQAESANKAAADLLALLEEEEEQARSKKQKQQEKKKKKKDAKKVKKEEEPEPERVVEKVAKEEEEEEDVEPEAITEPEPVVSKVAVKQETVSKSKNTNSKKKQQEKMKEVKMNEDSPIKPIVVTIPPPVSHNVVPNTLTSPTSPSENEWVKATGKKTKNGAKKLNAGSTSTSGVTYGLKESSATSSVTSEFPAIYDIDSKKKRQWQVTVSGSIIARLIGRGGTNINAVREATGAIIEVSNPVFRKEEKIVLRKDQDRQVTVRGSPESVRSAVQIIQMLINDQDVLINDVIRSVLKGSSSVTSSASSDGAVSRSGHDTISNVLPPPPPLTIAKSIKLVSASPAPQPATGNVWQQRMAARQEQIAKTQGIETPVKAVQQVKPIEEPILRKEPVSAVIAPLPKVEPQQHLPEPIGRPRIQKQESEVASFPKAPGSRLPNTEFSRAPAPPVDRTESFQQARTQRQQNPVAFGQFMPPDSNTSTVNSLFASSTSSSGETNIHEESSRKYDIGDELGDLSKLRLFGDDKMSEIWGNPSRESSNEGDSLWGGQLFSGSKWNPLFPSVPSSQGDWNNEVYRLSQQPQNSSQESYMKTSIAPTSQPASTLGIPPLMDFNTWGNPAPFAAPSTTLSSVSSSSSNVHSTIRDSSKTVPLFARSQSTMSTPSMFSDQQQLSSLQQQIQSRQLALMQQQQQQQNLLNQLASSISEQANTHKNIYSQLAAQLLTHQESSSSGATLNIQPQSTNPMASNYHQTQSYHDHSLLGPLAASTRTANASTGIKQFTGFNSEPLVSNGTRQEEELLNELFGATSAESAPSSTSFMSQRQQSQARRAQQPPPFGVAPPPGFSVPPIQRGAQSFHPASAQHQQSVPWDGFIAPARNTTPGSSAAPNKPSSTTSTSLWGNTTWN